MGAFKFGIGQKVKIRWGRFPLGNPADERLVGQVGIIERSWNPRPDIGEEHIARSEGIQFFELNQYHIRIGDSLYLFDEDWIEET